MNEKYINAADCAEFFYEHLDDNGMTAALNAIEEMPAADVKPVKHARWIKCCNLMGEYYKCSECGYKADVPTCMGEPIFTYCPSCGAKMDGGAEND